MFPAPACIVSLDIKLDSEELVHPAVAVSDFSLSSEIVWLIALLDKMQRFDMIDLFRYFPVARRADLKIQVRHRRAKTSEVRPHFRNNILNPSVF